MGFGSKALSLSYPSFLACFCFLFLISYCLFVLFKFYFILL
ncbi:hypothetical protein HMPREF1434_01432 [Helicobacter pylori GAMchJs124i]|nr:hypothetical protein HMPREF1434_01432 [Helicobacter pylori GAMchJs124i]